MTSWKKFSEDKPPENISVLFRGFEDSGFKEKCVRSGFSSCGHEVVLLHENGHRCVKLADDYFDELEWMEIPE